MADHVYARVADSARSVTPANRVVLRRTCGCGQSGVPCSCQEKDRSAARGKMLPTARSAQVPCVESDYAPAMVEEVLRTPGQPLGESARAAMEPRFSYDFSKVRIHTDARAAESARAVDAAAYTVGQHIAFGTGRYNPGTIGGDRLLAHELTHVMQQPAVTPAAPIHVGAPDNPSEREADAIASGLPPGTAAHASPAGPAATLQRQAPGVPPMTPLTGLSPTEGLSSELFQFPKILGEGFGGATATGDVVAGGTALGEGTFVAAEAGTVVTGTTTTVAPVGPLVVGGTTVGEGAVVVGGKVVIGTAAAVGAVVVGALIVAGAIYLLVTLMPKTTPQPAPGEEYPGNLLPGGVPTPATLPGTTGQIPAQAPGTTGQVPAQAPGPVAQERAQAPGPVAQEPVQTPRLIDSPVECARAIKAGSTHDHHIFPKEYINEFAEIGINVDDYTVTLKATEHIGRRGIHITMDWNYEWAVFFDKIPVDLTDADKKIWRTKAFKKAFGDMVEANIDQKTVHPYKEKP